MRQPGGLGLKQFLALWSFLVSLILVVGGAIWLVIDLVVWTHRVFGVIGAVTVAILVVTAIVAAVDTWLVGA